MKFSQYFIIGVGIIFIIIAIYNVFSLFERYSQTALFDITAEPGQLGVFDPSMAVDGERAYLAYSSISLAANQAAPLIGVNLARSLDGGEDWSYQSAIFESKPGTLTQRINGQLTEVNGIWRYEMPSLVFTPNDTGREWKAYAYRYFWNGDVNLARQTGFIVYKSAGRNMSAWSQEQWLFSSNPYNPPAPLNKLVQMHLNVLSPDLEDIIAYSDPAAFYHQGVIYMTLSAFTNIDQADRIILIASGDQGQSWRYMGTFMTAQDIINLADGVYNRMSNAQIIRRDNSFYLLITLGDDTYNGRGVFALPIQDINRAQLVRDENNAPTIAHETLLNTENLSTFGGGSADYNQNLSAGLLMSRALNRAENAFQIGAYGHEMFE